MLIVKLKRARETPRILTIPTYNTLFYRIKGNYYTPIFSLPLEFWVRAWWEEFDEQSRSIKENYSREVAKELLSNPFNHISSITTLKNILYRKRIVNAWRNLKDSSNIEQILVSPTHPITDIDLIILKKINPSNEKVLPPLDSLYPLLQNNKLKYSDFIEFWTKAHLSGKYPTINIELNNVPLQVHPEFSLLYYYGFWDKQLTLDEFVRVLEKYSNIMRKVDLTPALPLKLIKIGSRFALLLGTKVVGGNWVRVIRNTEEFRSVQEMLDKMLYITKVVPFLWSILLNNEEYYVIPLFHWGQVEEYDPHTLTLSVKDSTLNNMMLLIVKSKLVKNQFGRVVYIKTPTGVVDVLSGVTY